MQVCYVEDVLSQLSQDCRYPCCCMPLCVMLCPADGPSGLHRYRLRLLFDAVDMRWDWPVDTNVHEAHAYCAWKTAQDGQLVKYRLITEAEHNCIRNKRDRVDAVARHAASAAAAAVAAAPKGSKPVVTISAVAGGAVVGAGGSLAAEPAVNLDMVMVVSGCDAVKVGLLLFRDLSRFADS